MFSKIVFSETTLDEPTKLILSAQALVEASNTLTLLDGSLKALIETCVLFYYVYFILFVI